MVEVLLVVIGLLAASLLVSLYFLWKFVKIVMIFEDDLSAAIDALNSVEDTIDSILNMQLFFDSPEVRQVAQGILEEIRLCRAAIGKIVQRFTARSKQQFVTIWDEPEIEVQERRSVPMLPGQPPGTPNPMEMIRQEGIIFDARYEKGR